MLVMTTDHGSNISNNLSEIDQMFGRTQFTEQMLIRYTIHRSNVWKDTVHRTNVDKVHNT